MSCDFTFKHLMDTLEKAKNSGFYFYTMKDYSENKPKDKFIIMRHDVDLSLKYAMRMAMKESESGIKSTYFVRVNGLLSPKIRKNSSILKKITNLGHEIGLHYDSDVIRHKNFLEKLKRSKSELEAASGQEILGAALHKIKLLDSTPQIEKLNFAEKHLDELGLKYDAYSEVFNCGNKYISDSSRKWREGCICENMSKFSRIYLLTHPIWWSDNTTSLVTIIEELLKK